MNKISEDFAKFLIKAFLWMYGLTVIIVVVVVLGPTIKSFTLEKTSKDKVTIEAGK